MSKSKSTGKVSTHCTTAKGGARKLPPSDPESLIGYAKLLKLRSCAESTQRDYLRYVRRVAARHGGDPAGLAEAQVRMEKRGQMALLSKTGIGIGYLREEKSMSAKRTLFSKSPICWTAAAAVRDRTTLPSENTQGVTRKRCLSRLVHLFWTAVPSRPLFPFPQEWRASLPSPTQTA